MAATLKDVAELAGVSIATVSRVLNNPEKVAAQSRNRVLEAVDRLGYSSNLLAKSLRQDGLNAVYVLLPSLSDPFFAQMHQGISDVLASYDYLMLSAATEGSQSMEQDALAKARSVGPAGVLAYSNHRDFGDTAARVCGGFPTLLLAGNAPADGSSQRTLTLDRGTLGVRAAQALLQQGRKQLLCLCEDPEGLAGDLWTGIQTAAKAQRAESFLCPAGRSLADARRALELFLAASPLPDGILAETCQQAAGALAILRERGVSVPADTAVLTFENSDLARLTTPELSALGPSGYQVGMVGAARLLAWIRGEDEGPSGRRDALDVNLILRGSSHG